MFVLPLFALFGGALAQQSGAQNASYAPYYVNCPSNTTFVRPASQGLSPSETAWLAKRQPQVITALESYLNMVNIQGFNTSAYISALQANVSSTPKIAMTFSGGGQRARTIGLSMYNAFDERNSDAVQARTGGLSQALTYVAGLSGGSQTIAALAMSDFASLAMLVANGNLMDPSANATNNAFTNELGAKCSPEGADFNCTFADVFAATQFENLVTNSSTIDPFSRTFSAVRTLPNFSNGSTPLPFFMFNEVIPAGLPGSVNYNGILYPAFNTTNQTIYEASPFEWGSWQGRAAAFADLAYLGTQFNAGHPVNSSLCVNGFDSAAFLSSSSLSATNLWIIQNQTQGMLGQFDRRRRFIDLEKRQGYVNGNPPFYGPSYPANEPVIEQIRVANGTTAFVDGALPSILAASPFLFDNKTLEQLTWAQWTNAFQGFSASDGVLQTQEAVYLQDGSETGQVNPYVVTSQCFTAISCVNENIWPVIQTQRSSDFIIVTDNSGTELSSGWMNGTNFQATSAIANANNIPFPVLPDSMTFVNSNYTIEPTLFGCNEPGVPLVLFVADAPYTAYSNYTPVLNSNLSNTQISLLAENTLANVAQINSSRSDWPECIACAAVYRSLERLNITIPEVCSQCMSKYCWQGNFTTEPATWVAPTLRNNASLDYNDWLNNVWLPAGPSAT